MINTRVAPSPTGLFHLGTARTAYQSYLMARATGGKFILRIDDTDTSRNDPAYTKIILDSMKWLGLDYDDLVFQSSRFDFYRSIANDFVKNDYAIIIDGNAIQLSKYVLDDYWTDDISGNIAITQKHRDLIDNLILIKSDGIATYNFCSIVDDYFLNIDHVIRGTDHIDNTSKQIAIWNILNTLYGKKDIKFSHVGLIFKDKSKLSKRDGSATLDTYKDINPNTLLNFILKLGWSHPDANFDKHTPLINKDLAIKIFLDGKLKNSPSNFDQAKLNWFIKKYGD